MTVSPPWASLATRLEGELLLDDASRARYAEDASVHYVVPAAVACPSGLEDLRSILAFCLSHGISVHGRGAGTSRGGQPLGPGLVIDFRRHWQKILSFDERSGEVTAEPGVLYSELQKFLRAHGRSFPPDPSYHQCTLAGMIANNAAGIHSVKYGGTADYVAGVEFLTPDGELHHTDRPDSLASRVGGFLREHAQMIQSDYPRVEKNSCGYALDKGLRADGTADLPRLLTGSEGTLALITSLRLRTVPLPAATATGLLYFSSLEAALQASMDLRSYDISACELVDKVLLDLHHARTEGAEAARAAKAPHHAKRMHAANPYLELFYTARAQAVLVVETEGSEPAQALTELERAFAGISTRATEQRLTMSETETAAMWELRRHTSPILNRLEDGKISIKPLWAVEDVSLPPANFLAYVRAQRDLFLSYGLNCSFFGHSATCNLHLDPVESDPRRAREDAELARLYEEVAAASYELCIRHGGAISGEHGDGLTRTAYLAVQYPRAHVIFSPFKALFDPAGILNPGKIAVAGSALEVSACPTL